MEPRREPIDRRSSVDLQELTDALRDRRTLATVLVVVGADRPARPAHDLRTRRLARVARQQRQGLRRRYSPKRRPCATSSSGRPTSCKEARRTSSAAAPLDVQRPGGGSCRRFRGGLVRDVGPIVEIVSDSATTLGASRRGSSACSAASRERALLSLALRGALGELLGPIQVGPATWRRRGRGDLAVCVLRGGRGAGRSTRRLDTTLGERGALRSSRCWWTRTPSAGRYVAGRSRGYRSVERADRARLSCWLPYRACSCCAATRWRQCPVPAARRRCSSSSCCRCAAALARC